MSYQLTYQLTIAPRDQGVVVVTATADDEFAQTFVTVDNMGVYNTLNLIRVVDSVETHVRGATNLPVTGVQTVDIFDPECPLDVDVFYRAYLDGVGTSFDSNVAHITTDGQTFWLKDVILQSYSTKIKVESMSEITRPANILGTFKVLGRQNPVIVTDVRQGRTGTMVLSAYSVDDSKAIADIIASGNTLLFQAPGNAQFKDMYFQAGDISESWRGVSSDPIHSWTIPFTETDPPSEQALSLGSNSWLIVAQFETWQDVLNKRLTWEAVFVTPFSDNDV